LKITLQISTWNSDVSKVISKTCGRLQRSGILDEDTHTVPGILPRNTRGNQY